jgi:hypothetical protein
VIGQLIEFAARCSASMRVMRSDDWLAAALSRWRFTCQSRDALIGRRQGNQWLGEFHGGTGLLQNPLFLANVTMPS